MRFLLDESVDPRLAAHLRAAGHDAALALDDPGRGSPDRVVLEAAANSGRILITNDQGFGELVFRSRLPHAGVILFRMQALPLDEQRAALSSVIREHERDLGGFLVASQNGIRTRRAD